MQLTIGARKSDLARIQAYMVGDALQKQFVKLNVSYVFSSSLGDQNQQDPLWKMPSQGVFTQDFRQKLLDGDVDMVVHSWKDLPTENDGSTMLAATLNRADPRDLLLIKKSVLKEVEQNSELRLLSSSPRRMHNLTGFLKRAMPGGVKRIRFEDVRGNIQTRLDKLLGGDAHGLVVAKAAIDRLLGAQDLSRRHDNFASSVKKIRHGIEQCQWMVLPVSCNPPAAAQGALVVEVASGRNDLVKLLAKINHLGTFEDVEAERKILKLYGGGCHQKIGVCVETRELGKIFALRGMTDAGENLDQFEVVRPGVDWSNIEENEICPPLKSGDFFVREPVLISEKSLAEMKKADALLLASSAIPQSYLRAIGDQLIWASGVKSWFEFAAQGIWVCGCDDNLGAGRARQIEHLWGGDINWLTLTHRDSPSFPSVATYVLKAKSTDFSPGSKKYFYWRSGSLFKRALELFPEIVNGVHSCGMGQTFDIIHEILGKNTPLYVFVNENQWKEMFKGMGAK